MVVIPFFDVIFLCFKGGELRTTETHKLPEHITANTYTYHVDSARTGTLELRSRVVAHTTQGSEAAKTNAHDNVNKHMYDVYSCIMDDV